MPKQSAAPRGPLTGRDRADRLHAAAIGYYVKKRFSCYREVGVLRRGRRRADIIAMAMNRYLVGIEVKQSWADFKADIASQKYLDYMDYCNQFYFCLPWDFGDARLDEAFELLPAEVGIMVLEQNGLCAVFKPSRKREIDQECVRYIVTKLAWRGGTNRSNSRRNRVYL